MEIGLSVKNLTMKYQDRTILENFDLELPKGRIVGLLGPNGSGKTTLIKAIAGLLTPAAGEITVCGEQVGVATKAMVSYLPDRITFNRESRVRHLVEYYADFFGDFDRSRAEEMLRSLDISPDARIKALSKGSQEKVQLVLAMSRRAKLYLLDEPIGGVDPAARDYILNTIISNYDPEATVLITTHLIADVERILDDFLFLQDGKIIMQGNADEKRAETGRSLDEAFREVFVCSGNC